MLSLSSSKSYINPLLKIALPIMISNIITQVQMVIDRLFLARLGDLYMSALSNITSPMWTTLSFVFSLSIGASILISQAIGAGDKEKIGNYAGALWKWHNLTGIILFLVWFFFSEMIFKAMGVSENVMPMCLSYSRIYSPVYLITPLGAACMVTFQTSNYTKPLVYQGIIRSGLNIFLDWVMIFGNLGCPAMGISGAALATTIAEIAGGITLLVVIIFKKNMISMPSFRQIIKSKFSHYIAGCKLGVNSALEDFLWNLGNLMLIRILNSIDELAAGIYSVVFSVEILAMVLVASLGNGTMTLTGEATGKKDSRQFRAITKIAYGLSAIASGLTLILCFAIPRQLLGLFITDKILIEGSVIFMWLMGINLFSKSGNIILGSAIRGYGNTKWMFFTQTGGTIFVIALASLFVFGFKLGITGVFIAVLTDELIRCLINFGKYLSIRKLEPKRTLIINKK